MQAQIQRQHLSAVLVALAQDLALITMQRLLQHVLLLHHRPLAAAVARPRPLHLPLLVEEPLLNHLSLFSTRLLLLRQHQYLLLRLLDGILSQVEVEESCRQRYLHRKSLNTILEVEWYEAQVEVVRQEEERLQRVLARAPTSQAWAQCYKRLSEALLDANLLLLLQPAIIQQQQQQITERHKLKQLEQAITPTKTSLRMQRIEKRHCPLHRHFMGLSTQ